MPFILLCALSLTTGIVGYQRSLNKDFLTLGWLILVLIVIATWVVASHADQNYWQMVSSATKPAGGSFSSAHQT